MKSACAYRSAEVVGPLRAELAEALRPTRTGRSATMRIPNARARAATSWPIRPNPSTPSVFSYTSTPPNFDRSHFPPVSDECACGMLRASASINAIVCSAAATMFDCGAFATMIPRFVAASTSTLSTPIPARPITLQVVRALDQIRGQLRRRPDQDPVVAADPLRQLVARPADAEVDLEPLAQQVDARVGDLLGDEDLVRLRQHGAEP